ncbi:MAG: SH3 domain-containing protein [Lachnospiraceae bacterium]|nr:SH3 domain-containing protein [Lachnospiraceae bacterium]
MDQSQSKKILIFVIIFYILVTGSAICGLSLSGSVFRFRGQGSNILEYFSNLWYGEDARLTQSANKNDPENKLEGLEGLTEEASTEPVMEETSTEPPSEEVIEEPASEEVTEEVPSEPEPAEEEHYYSFTSNNTTSRLRMRSEPGETAGILYELEPGSKGYVVELGDEWSKVSYNGHTGYCANEFLSMTEISKEEYDDLVSRTDNAGGSENSDTTAGGTDQTATAAAETAPAAVTEAVPATTPETAQAQSTVSSGTVEQAAPVASETAAAGTEGTQN